MNNCLTAIGTAECIASDKSSEKMPALFKTSCFRLTVSQI